MRKGNKPAFSVEEISVFCEQISLILSANIPLYEGIETLESDYAGTAGEAAFRAMNEEMKASGSLAAAVEAAGVFPDYMTGMVRVGEEAGQLDAVMSSLAGHYMREAQIRSSAVSSIRYPLTLMGVMLLVIAVLVFRVMPVFRKAFASLSSGMSGTSAAMMQAGQTAGLVVLAAMLLLLGGCAVLALLIRSGKHPQLKDRLVKGVKPLAKLGRLMTAQKFASVMSMLLGSGFPMEQALELMQTVYDSEQDKALMRKTADRVLEGETITAAIEATELFDPLYLRMIRVGFSAGQADEALGKVARLQAHEIDEGMARLISLIEPVLVIALSAMIGALMLSVMMPLAGVLSVMA